MCPSLLQFTSLAKGDNLYTSLKNIGLSLEPGYLPNLRTCNLDDYKVCHAAKRVGNGWGL